MDDPDPSVSHEIVDTVSTALGGSVKPSLILRFNGQGGDSSIGTSRSDSIRLMDAAGDIGDARTGVGNVWRMGPTTQGVLHPSISVCGVSPVECAIFLWML